LADEGSSSHSQPQTGNGGEVAHRTSSKRIAVQPTVARLAEARLAMDRARLDLAVLVFPNFNQNFSVVDDLQSLEPLPSLEEVREAAGHRNPDLRAALALDVAKGDSPLPGAYVAQPQSGLFLWHRRYALRYQGHGVRQLESDSRRQSWTFRQCHAAFQSQLGRGVSKVKRRI